MISEEHKQFILNGKITTTGFISLSKQFNKFIIEMPFIRLSKQNPIPLCKVYHLEQVRINSLKTHTWLKKLNKM